MESIRAQSEPGSQQRGIAALAMQLGSREPGQRHPLLSAMGGVLGIVETVVPAFLFILAFTVTGQPWTAVAVSAGVSILFTVYRLVRREAPTQALVGLMSVVASAVLALVSQKPEDNFVLGMFTNGAYGIVFLLSILVRWPLIGVVVNLVRGGGTSWRQERHPLRVYTGVTFLWVGMFALRVIIEWPLYAAGNIGALGIAKLVLGLPLYVPVLAATWLIVRSLYRESTSKIQLDIS